MYAYSVLVYLLLSAVLLCFMLSFEYPNVHNHRTNKAVSKYCVIDSGRWRTLFVPRYERLVGFPPFIRVHSPSLRSTHRGASLGRYEP